MYNMQSPSLLPPLPSCSGRGAVHVGVGGQGAAGAGGDVEDPSELTSVGGGIQVCCQ